MKQEDGLRVVIFSEEGKWIAQCLEYDIGAQADTLDDLITFLELTVKHEMRESEVRNGEPFAGIPPAPERFHKMWERRSGAFVPERNSHLASVFPNYAMANCA